MKGSDLVFSIGVAVIQLTLVEVFLPVAARQCKNQTVHWWHWEAEF